jgi:hypothetical protein
MWEIPPKVNTTRENAIGLLPEPEFRTFPLHGWRLVDWVDAEAVATFAGCYDRSEDPEGQVNSAGATNDFNAVCPNFGFAMCRHCFLCGGRSRATTESGGHAENEDIAPHSSILPVVDEAIN